MCLVPEGRGVFPTLSVRENLTLQLPAWRKDGSIEAALDAFPALRGRLKQTAGSMSGGQQQMLSLARSYLCDPKVVLLDEVSMGLAPVVVDEIFEALRHLADSGTALLIVEQYVTRALDMADLAYVLDRGTVAFHGRSDELDADDLMRRYAGTLARRRPDRQHQPRHPAGRHDHHPARPLETRRHRNEHHQT